MRKKAAVMIYPHFSLQEITCLTSCLTVWYDREIDVFASSKKVMRSEEGFQVIADHTFDDFCSACYACLILPGILNPIPALFDEENIQFLKSLAEKDMIIASISNSPLLLAKAGLLQNRQFTCGVFDEMIHYLDFLPRENLLHVPIHRDHNIITAIGFAFREFAVQVMRAIGIECEDHILKGITKEYTKEELTFEMGTESFYEFQNMYQAYLRR